jgi:hypothetical protein
VVDYVRDRTGDDRLEPNDHVRLAEGLIAPRREVSGVARPDPDRVDGIVGRRLGVDRGGRRGIDVGAVRGCGVEPPL